MQHCIIRVIEAARHKTADEEEQQRSYECNERPRLLEDARHQTFLRTCSPAGTREPLVPPSSLCQKRRGLNPRNIKHPPAKLARHLIIQQHHITRRLGKLRAVACVGASGKAAHLTPHQPFQIVLLDIPAVGAVQVRCLGFLRLTIKATFIHNDFYSNVAPYFVAKRKLATATSSLGGTYRPTLCLVKSPVVVVTGVSGVQSLRLALART